jgi:ABC-2 type transport system permease protein
VSRYWTVDDKNTPAPTHERCVPLEPYRLDHHRCGRIPVRLLALQLHRPSHQRPSPSRATADITALRAASAPVPVVQREHGTTARIRQWRRIVWNDLTGMLRGTAFLLVTGIGLLNMFLSLSFSTSLYENTIYPVTYHVNDVTEGSFSLFLMILITFYSGLLIWKEREPKFDEMHDATPIPLGIGLLGKYTAFMLLLAVLLVITTIGGMIFQLLNGYTQLEPGVYLGNYILPNLVGMAVMAALAFMIHVLVNNKYVGYAVFIVFLDRQWHPVERVGREHTTGQLQFRSQRSVFRHEHLRHLAAGVVLVQSVLVGLRWRVDGRPQL